MSSVTAEGTITVAQVLAGARASVPLREARALLQNVLGCSHAALAAHPERELASPQQAQFDALLQRRASGEPMAYLIGRCEFYGREFRVSPAVLIPRPETELLVELALERVRDLSCPRILDLGTGSGVLAISLALERPDAEVTGLEFSPAALDVARINAGMSDARIRLLRSEWFGAVAGESFDLIVANPPYVAAGDPHLAQGDLRFEPRCALTDGSADGLHSLGEIAAAAPDFLARPGWLLCEHGYDQGEACRDLMAGAGFSGVRTWRDLAGIDRVTGGCLPSPLVRLYLGFVDGFD